MRNTSQYLPLLGHFGGNQAWMHAHDRHLARVGCGVVAFADFALYRAWRYPAERTPLTLPLLSPTAPKRISQHRYVPYLLAFAQQYCTPPLPTGMAGFELALCMQRYYDRYVPSRRIRWTQALCTADPLPLFAQQLAHDFPVILSLPPTWSGKRLRMFHDAHKKRAVEVKLGGAHFVTLVDISYAAGAPMLVLISWGKRYFLPYTTYLHCLQSPTSWLPCGWIHVDVGEGVNKSGLN